MNYTKRKPEKVAKFLAALSSGATVEKALAASGISRGTVYEWRKADKAFAEQWDEAVEAGTDGLEDEAVRRGRDGVEKPVFQGGKQVGFVQEYSDTLLIFMLKGRRPEKFKDRHEHTGKDGGAIEVDVQDVRAKLAARFSRSAPQSA